MSELKAILATPHPKMKNACDGAIEVYPKYEADKVIAEKDAEIAELKERHKEEVDELQKATDSAWGKVNAMYDEILNHKYKRCLAIAYVEWLKQMSLCQHPESILYRRAARRERKWKELAEKFKLNKSTAK